VFFLAPTRLRLARALLGEVRPERLFDWRPERGSEVVVVPIDEPERVARLRTDASLTIDVRGAGGPRRFVWLATSDTTPRSIVRLDLERGGVKTWTPPRGQHVSEPVFAPRPGGTGETDGWGLVLVFDESTETSHVVVLDAEAPDAGPIGRAHFDHHVAVTLHGAWVCAD
jgi:carotenoid cleavage dioxygenase-like enzyme